MSIGDTIINVFNVVGMAYDFKDALGDDLNAIRAAEVALAKGRRRASQLAKDLNGLRNLVQPPKGEFFCACCNLPPGKCRVG